MERTEPVRVRTVLLLKDTSMALATELAEGAEEMNGEQFMGRMREVWLERERQAENAGRVAVVVQAHHPHSEQVDALIEQHGRTPPTVPLVPMDREPRRWTGTRRKNNA